MLWKNSEHGVSPVLRFSIRDVLWLMVVVAVALGVYVVRPRQQRWEYKTVYSATDGELTVQGDNGWELLSVEQMSNGQVAQTFKRRR